jgi:hypothetical protein
VNVTDRYRGHAVRRFIEPRRPETTTLLAPRARPRDRQNTSRGYMAKTTTTPSRESRKKLKPKPKTEGKSWQTRNTARKEKQAAHAATLAAKTE